MRKSSARKIERRSEGATLLRTPIELLAVEAYWIKPMAQFDRPVGERQVSLPAFLLAGWKFIK